MTHIFHSLYNPETDVIFKVWASEMKYGGGPIQCIVDGELTIVGVISYDIVGARYGNPTIYTRLADVRIHDWVQKYIH